MFDSLFFRAMNAQPVYISDKLNGFACGNCKNVFVLAENYPERLTKSQEMAEKHCHCLMCKKPNTGTKLFLAICDVCSWKQRFAIMWRDIGNAVKLGITNSVVWDVISDQLNGGDSCWQYELEQEINS